MKNSRGGGVRVKFSDYNTIQIHKGWSNDKKYLLTNSEGEKRLLRVADLVYLEEKKHEFSALKKLEKLQIPTSRPLEFGICQDKKQVWMLLSWVEGNDLEAEISQLTIEKQYQLGIEAGKILKQIHQIPITQPEESWEKRFNTKIDHKIKSYQECGLELLGDEQLLSYLQQNRHLLKNRPQVFHHGDYHIGNMLLTPEKNVAIIDLNRMDSGDPWEEFNRIIFCSEASPYFASGRINGYFNHQVSEAFFRLLALYIASNALAAIAWAKKFGDDEVEFMMKQGRRVLEDYQGMKHVIPKWYIPTL